jgi:hypothetical protein
VTVPSEDRDELAEARARREVRAATGLGTLSKPVSITRIITAQDPPALGMPTDVPVEDLYPGQDAGAASLVPTAMRILDECLQRLNAASHAVQAGDLVAADDESQHLWPSLVELFCCRRLGDGFGMVVVALRHSFDNQAGMPFSLSQLQSLRLAFTSLRQEPFLLDDRAVQVVLELEATGLKTDVAALDHLADEDEEQSVR